MTPRHASDADRAACAAMIETGSRSFHLAGRFLPQETREAAFALYAFCRLSDDSVDVDRGAGPAVARLRAKLDRVYAGRPGPDPVERALADAVTAFALPRALLDALLEGLEWDAAGRRYETLEALNAYAARVAGAVGALMAALMGVREPAMAARACDLGVAMQFTNIARDVGEDARAGRIYLPLDWLREAGLDVSAWLDDPRPCPAVETATRRLLAEADRLYARADAAIARLPTAFRPSIRAARLLYAGIGHELLRRGGDNVTARTVVPAPRKLALAASALLPAPAGRELRAAPLPQTQFLVEALAPDPDGPPAAPWWRLDAHWLWALTMLARAERRRTEYA